MPWIICNAFSKQNQSPLLEERNYTCSSLPMSLLQTRELNGSVWHHSSVPGNYSATLNSTSSHSAEVQAILSPCTQFIQQVLPGHWGLMFIVLFLVQRIFTGTNHCSHFPWLSWSEIHKYAFMWLNKVWGNKIYCLKDMHSCDSWEQVCKQCKQISKAILMCTKPRGRNLGLCELSDQNWLLWVPVSLCG